MKRQRITLVTRDDLVIKAIRGSGPGGQHRNKSYTGARITHPASGSVGVATDSRSHDQNVRAAFLRMTKTPEFKVWLDLQLHPENILIEVHKDGEWISWK